MSSWVYKGHGVRSRPHGQSRKTSSTLLISHIHYPPEGYHRMYKLPKKKNSGMLFGWDCGTQTNQHIQCRTPEDPPLNPCDRCAKKGLKCEYITIANQRDESSTSRSAPLQAESRHTTSVSAPASRRRSFASAPRTVDTWTGTSGRDRSATQSVLPELGPSSQHRSTPYRTQSAGHTADQYSRAYPAASFPASGTTQAHPYLDPARNFLSRRTHSHDGQAPVTDRAFYGAPQWARHVNCWLVSFVSILPLIDAAFVPRAPANADGNRSNKESVMYRSTSSCE
jgi:hypothetical protein